MTDLKIEYDRIRFVSPGNGTWWNGFTGTTRSCLIEWQHGRMEWVAKIFVFASVEMLGDIRDFLLQLNRRGAPTNSRAEAGDSQ